MDEDALSAHLAGTSLAPGPLGAYVARHKTEMMLACVSVIEVGTKATALSLRARSSAARALRRWLGLHSIDSTTAPQGGALGCIPDADFNAPLNKVIAGLTVGRVSSPVAFSSDWLLLLVSRREAETAQQLVPSLVAGEADGLEHLLPPSSRIGQGRGRPPIRHLEQEGDDSPGASECRTAGHDRAQPGRQQRAESLRLAAACPARRSSHDQPPDER